MKWLRHELEKVYEQFSRRLFTCALAITRSPELAEDAMHDAFCRLLSLKETPRDLKVYVFRSVRNAAVNLVRKSGRTIDLTEDYIFDPCAGPRETAEMTEFRRRAAEALQILSDDERETIVQHLYADLTFREIAEVRENSINTVASWYRRGLAKLRQQLEE